MSSAAVGVFDSIREFANCIGPNNIAVGKMQIGWLGRGFDTECEGEGNLMFYGPPRHSAERRNTPLLNRLHCGVYEQRVTRNRLQFDNRTIISKNQMEPHHPLDMRQSRFLWVNRLHEMHVVATQVLLLLWYPQDFRGGRSWGGVLRGCLRKKGEQHKLKNHLS